MSTDEAFPTTQVYPESQLKTLPTFEDWIGDILTHHHPWYKGAEALLQRTFWSVIDDISFLRYELMKICEETNGLMKQNDKEFVKMQERWQECYQLMCVSRAYLMRRYMIRPPNWKTQIMPERYYCGVLLDEEDFKRFLKKDPKCKEMTPETPHQQTEELEKEMKSRSQRRRERRRKLAAHHQLDQIMEEAGEEGIPPPPETEPVTEESSDSDSDSDDEEDAGYFEEGCQLSSEVHRTNAEESDDSTDGH